MIEDINTSQHWNGKKIVEIKRTFSDEHLAAGYHLAGWGHHATPKSKLIGIYQGRSEMIKVGYIDGQTGPEFEIEWEGGGKVTVIDEDTVLQYLLNDGAATLVED